MLQLRRAVHRLVPGIVSGPRSEIKSRSTFYPDALEQIYRKDDGDGLSPPVQETGSQDVLDSIEQSKVSVTSEDVQMCQSKDKIPCSSQIYRGKPYAQSQHKAICARSSYCLIKFKAIKIVVVGDKGAGKTSIVQRTTADQDTSPFSCLYNHTNLLNCSGKLLEHYGELYLIIFWELIDGAELLEEQYHKEFYNGAMAAFVVCESAKMDESSIVQQKKKINNAVCKKNGDPIPVYLLASKCDTECQNDGAMARLATVNGFAGYFQTSAKTGKGIEDVVRAAQKEILRETFPHPPEICETPDDLKR